MHIVPKITLKYGPVRDVDDGTQIPAHYFEFQSVAVWHPFCGLFAEFCETVDPTAYYGITRDQAIQLCVLNNLEYPQ